MGKLRVVWLLLCCLVCVLGTEPVTAQKSLKRSYWTYDVGHFENTAGNKWSEKFKKETFQFVEQDRTEKYVQLYDNSRDCIVRLFDDRCMVKFGKEAFTKHHDGKWVR